MGRRDSLTNSLGATTKQDGNKTVVQGASAAHITGDRGLQAQQDIINGMLMDVNMTSVERAQLQRKMTNLNKPKTAGANRNTRQVRRGHHGMSTLLNTQQRLMQGSGACISSQDVAEAQLQTCQPPHIGGVKESTLESGEL